jgi:aspartyl-tRNA(Asn)/glutamyl-tRNA(Gln) amidotransferase subunit B
MPMRSKEDAPDYRYFPDPDLIDIKIDQEFLQAIEDNVPELPDEKLDHLIKNFGIPRHDAIVLMREKKVSDFFEQCAPYCNDTKRLSHWLTKDLFKLLNDSSTTIEECPIRPKDFSHLINLTEGGDITDSIGRTVLNEMFQTGKAPESIIEAKDLKPMEDVNLLEKILAEVMAENSDVVSKIKQGSTKPIDFLIGQVMKKTRGKAQPKKVRELVHKKLLS